MAGINKISAKGSGQDFICWIKWLTICCTHLGKKIT